MTALLPCPGCGAKARHHGMDVLCPQCTFFASRGDWNRRAPVTVDDAMVERAWNIATLGFPDVGVCAISKDAMRAALEAALKEPG